MLWGRGSEVVRDAVQYQYDWWLERPLPNQALERSSSDSQDPLSIYGYTWPWYAVAALLENSRKISMHHDIHEEDMVSSQLNSRANLTILVDDECVTSTKRKNYLYPYYARTNSYE